MDCTDDGDGGVSCSWLGTDLRDDGDGGVGWGWGCRCSWLGRPTDFRDDSRLYRRWRWEVGGGG